MESNDLSAHRTASFHSPKKRSQSTTLKEKYLPVLPQPCPSSPTNYWNSLPVEGILVNFLGITNARSSIRQLFQCWLVAPSWHICGTRDAWIIVGRSLSTSRATTLIFSWWIIVSGLRLRRNIDPSIWWSIGRVLIVCRTTRTSPMMNCS